MGTGVAAPAGEAPAAASVAPTTAASVAPATAGEAAPATAGEAAPITAGEVTPASADEVVTQCAEVLRHTLALRGRAPFDFAGLTVYAILQDFAALLTRCLAHRSDARLTVMHHAVEAVLQTWATEHQLIQQGYQWLQEIRRILDAPLPTAEDPGPGSTQVTQQLQDYLDRLAADEKLSAPAHAFLHHVQGVTERYAAGLFHCYDVIGLPRTNNDLESDFRALKRHERRITGCAQTRQRLLRHGAWLPLQACTLTEAELQQRLAAVPVQAYWQERARLHRRLKQRRRCYQLRHGRDKLFGQIERQWRTLPPG